jgi:hypothetical protein
MQGRALRSLKLLSPIAELPHTAIGQQLTPTKERIMGFTLSRSTATSTRRSLLTPEQEAKAMANHKHMDRLSIDPPVTIGSEKQIKWAKAIASQFLFYAHAWSFTAADIDLLFEAQGKFAKFWIDNRPIRAMAGECRVAVEKALEAIHLKIAAEAEADKAIAELTPAEFKKKVGRL